MRIKEKERAEAIQLRQNGKSIKDIARRLRVSSSSVSKWVREVELTEEQKVVLSMKSKQQDMNRVWGARKKYAEERRSKWQDCGRRLMKDGENKFVAGCMLYWAEGAKSQNTLKFVNSDVDMMRFFVEFIREYFDVEDDDFAISLKFYSNEIMSFESAQEYWLTNLGLPSSCMRKSQVDVIRGDGYGKKTNKRPAGICSVQVNSTEILQAIYGGIKEFIGK